MILVDAFSVGTPPPSSKSEAARDHGRRSSRMDEAASNVEPVQSVAVAGLTSPGRPPSPYIGASTIWAANWVAFGAAALRLVLW